MDAYQKKPLQYNQQIALYKSRGLIIDNDQLAEKYLQEISYFRFSAYAIPFQKKKDKFDAGTTFQDILDLYLFDRELRFLVFDAIESIEIAIRTQMIYTLSNKYNDSHWQDNASLFNPAHTNPLTGKVVDIFADTQAIIKKHIHSKHPEVFIKHYKNTYNIPENPPSWMCVELLTIGELSRLFSALKQNADRKAIAQFFWLHHSVFKSWLHTIVYVRNLCAHHCRLWNREFAITPEVLLRPQQKWIQPAFNANNNRTFYFLCMLKYLLQTANANNNFKEKLEALFNKYPTTPIQFMGIPTSNGVQIVNWKTEDLWLI